MSETKKTEQTCKYEERPAADCTERSYSQKGPDCRLAEDPENLRGINVCLHKEHVRHSSDVNSGMHDKNSSSTTLSEGNKVRCVNSSKRLEWEKCPLEQL